LDQFLKRSKKGSKPFRRILDVFDSKKINLKNSTRTKTFFRLIALQIPEDEYLKKLNMQWTVSVFPIKLRGFTFKFRNNILGLNTRVAHFNNNINRGCYFCVNKNVQPIPDETFLHLFLECDTSRLIIQQFYRKFLTWDPLNNDDVKKFIFLGQMPNSEVHNFFIETISISICFYLWQCKLQKILPSQEGLLNELFYSVENIRRISPVLRNDMNLKLPLCRFWSNEASQRS
jgi:hypothetical protein